jgi:hypothetical protein
MTLFTALSRSLEPSSRGYNARSSRRPLRRGGRCRPGPHVRRIEIFAEPRDCAARSYDDLAANRGEGPGLSARKARAPAPFAKTGARTFGRPADPMRLATAGPRVYLRRTVADSPRNGGRIRSALIKSRRASLRSRNARASIQKDRRRCIADNE